MKSDLSTWIIALLVVIPFCVGVWIGGPYTRVDMVYALFAGFGFGCLVVSWVMQSVLSYEEKAIQEAHDLIDQWKEEKDCHNG